MFLRDDIMELFNDLSTLDLNTLVGRFPYPAHSELTITKATSTTANAIVKDCKYGRNI